ncbi:MAG: phage holin family protein [Chloroflexi bacterium]|nr:phage holin family protein [Chloroflexota bacterium]
MGFVYRLIVRLAINAAAICVAAWAISGIHLEGWKAILLVTVIFGLVNALIKPFVWVASCCLQCLTLGLFTLVINAAMLYLTEWFAGIWDLNFTIDNFLSAFLGALLISAVSFVLAKVFE